MISHLLLCVAMVAAPPAESIGPEGWAGLRLNQIQVVGTHNSYHLRPAALNTMMRFRRDAKQWDYSRQPLDQQLDHGIRNLELDLHLQGEQWLVMHVPHFDPATTVRTLPEAFTIVKSWSDAHPGHLPISFLMELKAEGIELSRAIRDPQAADLENLDTVIRQTFPTERLITPDLVRGQHETLLAAVQAGNWPALSDAAGKVFVILHTRGRHRQLYMEGHPALEGRAMFVNSEPGQPHAATIVLDNPGDPDIARLAAEGYLIRTRVDGQDDIRAARRAQALACAAQILTTDYPSGEIEDDRAFGLPDEAPARVNPATGPENLRGKLLIEKTTSETGSQTR